MHKKVACLINELEEPFAFISKRSSILEITQSYTCSHNDVHRDPVGYLSIPLGIAVIQKEAEVGH